MLGVLASLNRLPAPAITRLESLDEKLRFIRERPELDPVIVAVGSSVAWRQLDGRPFAERVGAGRFLNGASAFLKVHQTRFLSNFYLEHFKNLNSVLVMLGPTDFEDCTTVPREVFDLKVAGEYAFERSAAAPLYVQHFAPMVYARRAKGYAKMRVPLTGEMWMDEYGSGPMQWTDEMMRGLRYAELPFDHACVEALRGLISDIRAKNVRAVVVFAPLHPDYRRKFPQVVSRLRGVSAQIAAEAPRGVRVLDRTKESDDASDFFDAIHLQWTAVRTFSDRLVQLVLADVAAADGGQSLSK
jgi:hypothetical protein